MYGIEDIDNEHTFDITILSSPRHTAWMEKSENTMKFKADAKFMKDRPGGQGGSPEAA